MSNENETIILDALDKFLTAEVDPFVHDLEAADEYPHEIVEKMKEMGIFCRALQLASCAAGLAWRVPRLIWRSS